MVVIGVVQKRKNSFKFRTFGIALSRRIFALFSLEVVLPDCQLGCAGHLALSKGEGEGEG